MSLVLTSLLPWEYALCTDALNDEDEQNRLSKLANHVKPLRYEGKEPPPFLEQMLSHSKPATTTTELRASRVVQWLWMQPLDGCGTCSTQVVYASSPTGKARSALARWVLAYSVWAW